LLNVQHIVGTCCVYLLQTHMYICIMYMGSVCVSCTFCFAVSQ